MSLVKSNMELPVETVNIFNSVINDITAIQSRYDSSISLMNAQLKKARADNQRFVNQIEMLQEQLQTISIDMEKTKKERDDVVMKYHDIEYANQNLSKQLMEQLDLVRKYINTINELEEDKKAFTKVSHVVAIEKENARLRQEIILLKNKKTYGETHQSVKVMDEPVETITTFAENETVASVKEHQSNNTIDVYEKKIKGKIYFVSKGEDMTVFNKRDDGSIGDPVGVLEKHGEKFKITWL